MDICWDAEEISNANAPKRITQCSSEVLNTRIVMAPAMQNSEWNIYNKINFLSFTSDVVNFDHVIMPACPNAIRKSAKRIRKTEGRAVISNTPMGNPIIAPARL